VVGGSKIALDDELVQRLYRKAGAERWSLPIASFRRALIASAERAVAASGRSPSAEFFATLHLDDLALACACADGIDSAWEHFVRELRPQLIRAADALDRTGAARELADAIYGDLYGVRSADAARKSLFDYFHGRSSLATWLRAVLSQRYVDRLRSMRKFTALEEEPASAAARATLPSTPAVDDDIDRVRHAQLIEGALRRVIAALDARDRLRLGCYYAQDMTLAAIGRVTGEHEATVSRHLARTRRRIREAVEHDLRTRHGLPPAEIEECFAAVTSDPGELNLGELLAPRKKASSGRSI
jgi:RNA polymerase sigma-70 factor